MNNYKKMKTVSVLQIITLCFGMFIGSVFAESTQTSSQLEKDVDALKAEASELERDIGLLEKDLLFPPLTRVEVFVSVDPSLEFTLQHIALEIDGDEKSFHLYTANDITALQMGGLQHFWEGNVALGQHDMIVEFKGKNAKGISVKQTLEHKFEKGKKGATFELQVMQGANSKTPKFSIKAWDKR